jgi:hypothetical protein
MGGSRDPQTFTALRLTAISLATSWLVQGSGVLRPPPARPPSISVRLTLIDRDVPSSFRRLFRESPPVAQAAPHEEHESLSPERPLPMCH